MISTTLARGLQPWQTNSTINLLVISCFRCNHASNSIKSIMAANKNGFPPNWMGFPWGILRRTCLTSIDLNFNAAAHTFWHHVSVCMSFGTHGHDGHACMCEHRSDTAHLQGMHGIADENKCKQYGEVGPRKVKTDSQIGSVTARDHKHLNCLTCALKQGIPQGCKERQRDTSGRSGCAWHASTDREQERPREANREAKACMASEVL